jgi:hypothetical protein
MISGNGFPLETVLNQMQIDSLVALEQTQAKLAEADARIAELETKQVLP